MGFGWRLWQRVGGLGAAGWLVLGLVLFLPRPVLALGFEDVVLQAQALAAERHAPPARSAPEALTALDYKAYQALRHRPEAWVWRDAATPFRVELQHVGSQYSAPVEVFLVDSAGVQPLAYDPAQFDFGGLSFDPAALEGSGIAGLQVRFPVTGPESRDVVASFLGASHFQMMAAGSVPGASARGLAIDTGLASGEQFPWFRKFWLLRPAPGDKHLTLFALLDAPSVTGAYRFVLHPGATTTADVQARLFFRGGVGKLGLAPLTSMFLYGGGAGPSPADAQLRPEVHDSDGLAMVTARGEWIWRPLNNPRRLAISVFQLDNPRGFGLMQRTRDFGRYEDLAKHYERRPSVWVEPQGDWGPGHLELVEIPATDETNANVVAFWVPSSLPASGGSQDLAYRLRWSVNPANDAPQLLGYVKQTRRGAGAVRGGEAARKPDGTTRLQVDFVGGTLADLPDGAIVTLDLSHGGNAEILQSEVQANPVYGGYRLLLRVKPLDTARPIELRAQLLHEGQAITEVWSYQIPHG